MKKDNFEQSHSAEKSERGDSLGFSNIYYVPKYLKKLKGDPLVQSKNFRKKSHSAKKIQVKITQIAKVGILSCFQGSGRRFYNFG